MFGRRVSAGDLVPTLYGRASVGDGVVTDVHFQVRIDERHPSVHDDGGDETRPLLNVNKQQIYVNDETPYTRTHELRTLLSLAVPVVCMDGAFGHIHSTKFKLSETFMIVEHATFV